MAWMRAIEAAKRARTAAASTARTRRVAMFPESSQSSGSAGFGALVEFVKLPLRGVAVEMRHALADHLITAGGDEKLESHNVGAAGKLLALPVHPENARK